MKAEKILKEIEKLGFGVETGTVYVGSVFTVALSILKTKDPEGSEQRVVMFGEGIARKSFRDKRDPQIGINIATSRALNAIWKKMHRLNGRVHAWYMG